MIVRERSEMPDGTKIQIEDWKEDYPGVHDTLTIAAYPKAKNTGKYSWVRKGETFRLEISRGFKTDEHVKEVFDMLSIGCMKLEDLADNYWDGQKAKFYMGLAESEGFPEEHICGECKYCEARYDKRGDEVISCFNDVGRGTDDEAKQACMYFERRD